MSDDDLIRRGDAVRAMPTGWTGAVNQSNMDYGPNVASRAVRAILSLPAVQPQGVKVKPLVWEKGDQHGGFYAEFEIINGFTGYYQITQEKFGLAAVEFGIHCHEFGHQLVWKGPSDQAEAAAQAHYNASILTNIEPASVTLAAALALPEVKAMVEALLWYADETNYDRHYVPRSCGCCSDDDIPTELDRGERARTALSKAQEEGAEG